MMPTPCVRRLAGCARAAPLCFAVAMPLAAPAFAAPGGPPSRESDPPADLAGQPQGFGLGLSAGEPTGLAFSVRKQREQAINGVVGWSFTRDWLSVTTDYTRTIKDLESDATPDLRYPIYAGVGLSARVGGSVNEGNSQSNVQVGVRVPIGIMLQPTHVRLDLSLEVAPAMVVVPDFGFGFDGALVARYYFGDGSH